MQTGGIPIMGEQSSVTAQVMAQMNRIESKVDTMQTAFVQMARTEERVVRLLESDQEKTKWLLQLQARVVEIEKNDIGTKAVTSRFERAMWIIVTASVAAVVGWLASNGGV